MYILSGRRGGRLCQFKTIFYITNLDKRIYTRIATTINNFQFKLEQSTIQKPEYTYHFEATQRYTCGHDQLV